MIIWWKSDFNHKRSDSRSCLYPISVLLHLMEGQFGPNQGKPTSYYWLTPTCLSAICNIVLFLLQIQIQTPKIILGGAQVLEIDDSEELTPLEMNCVFLVPLIVSLFLSFTEQFHNKHRYTFGISYRNSVGMMPRNGISGSYRSSILIIFQKFQYYFLKRWNQTFPPEI